VKELLISIRQTIDHRVSAAKAAFNEWPCHAGCDHCCRHLAAIPAVTEAEWTRLSSAIAALSQPSQNEVVRRISHLEEASYPFVCPLLDATSGRCLVYEERPLACRTYGFYVERAEGLFCDRIRSLADSGRLDQVVWGSQAGVEERSAGLGVRRSLVDWLKRDSGAG
jgi:Fe-S-cluster containining protein